MLSLLLAASLVAVGAFPASARAAEYALGQSPTSSVEIPAAAIASEGDASSLVVNPALLPFLRAWNLMALHTELDPGGRRPGTGDGIYFAIPAPYLSRLALGLGLEVLRPPSGALPNYGTTVKLSLGAAVRLARFASFGFAYYHLFNTAAAGPGGVDTLDLGLALRFGAHLGIGVVARDLTCPEVDGVPLQRVWDSEVAVRPWRDDRLELAAGLAVGERRGDLAPHGRFQLRLGRGLWLRGDISLPAVTLDDQRSVRDLRATTSLAVDLEHLSLGVASMFGSTPVGGASLHGVSAFLRASGERRRPLLRLSRRVERVALGDFDSDRDFVRLCLHLRALQDDPDVAGVLAVVGDLDLGWARLQELRQRLSDLRTSGKRVFAYLEQGSLRDYYLAAAAERVYLHPGGELRLLGLSSTLLFFKGTLDRLGVRADFVRIGDYKAAPEALTRRQSSPPAREEREQAMGEVWSQIAIDVARDRGLELEVARQRIAAGPYPPRQAVQAQLADQLAYPEELEQLVPQRVAEDVFLADAPSSPRHPTNWSAPVVAVVHVEGDLIEGQSRDIPLVNLHLAGSETLVGALAWAADQPRIRAVVLRVDSPGGTVFAAEQLAHATERLRLEKPVVVSMGDKAASGGYFLAAPADAIYAQPATLTGSIGVFFGKVDVSGLLAKLGIDIERHALGERAELDSLYRGYSDEERALLLRQIGYHYQRFVDTVARGRKLTPQAVDRLGQGRVWTGAQGRLRGLVDHLGGVVEAVSEARRRAGIADGVAVEILSLPAEQPGLLRRLLRCGGGVQGCAQGGDDGDSLDGGGEPTGGRRADAGVARTSGHASRAKSKAAMASAGGSTASASDLLGLLGPRVGGLLRALPVSLLLSGGRGLARLPFELVFE